MPLSPRSLAPIIENAFPINGLSKETFDNLSLYIPHPKYCFTDTSRSIQCNKDDNVALFLNSNNKNTNVLMNPNMYGAIPGTPGRSPTGWGVYTSPGISREIVAVGSELVNGVNTPYVDVRFFGTATAGGSNGFDPSPISGIPANIGDRWTVSVYLKLISANGTMPSNSYIVIPEVGSNSAILLSETQNIGGSVLNNSTYTRVSRSKTFSSPSVKFASFFIRTVLAINETIDFTIRIAAPMLEKLATPSANYNVSQMAYQIVAGNQPKLRKGSKNWILNSSMSGFITGPIGIAPSNWYYGSPAGVSRQIVAVGSELVNGVNTPYVDVRFYSDGNNSGNGDEAFLDPSNISGITSSLGQLWSFSVYLKLVSGSFPSANQIKIQLIERNSSQAFLTASQYFITDLSGGFKKYTVTRTTNQSSVASIQPTIRYSPPINTVFDFTIRIAAPQLELGTNVTSDTFVLTNGSPASNGVGNWWLDFDGVQTRLQLNNLTIPGGSKGFVSVAVDVNNSIPGNGTIYSSCQTSAITPGWMQLLYFSSTTPSIIGYWRNDNNLDINLSSNSYSKNVYTSLVNNTNSIIRRAGNVINSSNIISPPINTNNACIGALNRNNGYDSHFKGGIYGISILGNNYVPTDSEILSTEKFLASKLDGLIL